MHEGATKSLTCMARYHMQSIKYILKQQARRVLDSEIYIFQRNDDIITGNLMLAMIKSSQKKS